MKEKMLLSFELFPPKTDKGMENLPGTIEHLCEYKPEYTSCTYGAGGTNVGKNMDVCKMIQAAVTGTKNDYHLFLYIESCTFYTTNCIYKYN